MYNEEKNIDRILNNILEQTYSNFEVILINDGSKDKTHEICQKYTSLSSKFKYYYQKNSGVAKARNLGLKKSTGEFIGFLDADDYIENNYLEKLIEGYREDSIIDLVVCSYTQNEEIRQFSNKIIGKKKALNELLDLKGSKGYLWNKLFQKKIIVENNLWFDKNIKVVSDLPFCVEYITKINNIKYLSDVLVHYSINSTSISNDITNPKFLTQLDALSKCIYLVQQDGSDDSTIKKYITAYIRATTGIIFRRKFPLTRSVFQKLYDALNKYKINDIKNLFVKFKYIIAKIQLSIYRIKIKI